jgi:hypothetical protein
MRTIAMCGVHCRQCCNTIYAPDPQSAPSRTSGCEETLHVKVYVPFPFQFWSRAATLESQRKIAPQGGPYDPSIKSIYAGFSKAI